MITVERTCEAGNGVHVPVVKGTEASVSFSITCRTPESDRRGAVYEVNDRLRRYGLLPRPVGKAPVIDRAKYAGYALYTRVKKRIER